MAKVNGKVLVSMALLCIAVMKPTGMAKFVEPERLRPKASETISEGLKIHIPRHVMEKIQKNSFSGD